jgi:CBS domain-containing protein
VRQLPVLRDGKLVGLLRRRDVIKWLQLHSEMSLS